MLKDHLEPQYLDHMPACQHGAVAGKGTEMASHVIHSIIDYAALHGRSVLVLFADLCTAFDKVIRQLLYGWGTHPPRDKLAALIDLG
eukprot:2750663-Karenia_brevis.AAC.1